MKRTFHLFGHFIAVAMMSFFCVSLCAAQSAISPADDPCEKLVQLRVPNASVTLAQATPAGTYSGAPEVFSGRDLSALYKSLPTFCRVEITAKPTSDSDIKVALWLPFSGWNGRFQGFGNGGFAGQIDYGQIAMAVRLGYAAAATDAGHMGSPADATWVVGHPEKVIDFGYRGVHEMTRVSKIVIRAFYGNPVKHSYFAGCSDGGREALMEAQRYPEDYDGILGGAPAINFVSLISESLYFAQILTTDPASYIPQAKLPAIAAAVNADCDQLDGVKDGILNDPRKCHFDPATIKCKAGEDMNQCLTAPQVASLKQIYAGLPDASDHIIFPGYAPGAEDAPGGWSVWITGPMPKASVFYFLGNNFFSYFVYGKADWDYKTFTVAKDEKLAESTLGAQLDAADPDLKPFAARGGKLVMYHGWNDSAIPALNSVNYFDSVQRKMGVKSTDSFLRLYMVPGMLHCGGGPGPSQFGGMGDFTKADASGNMRLSLEQWTEGGAAPGVIIASKRAPADWHVTMTRPLCPYPQAAKYKGSGDTNDAANFVCAEK